MRETVGTPAAETAASPVTRVFARCRQENRAAFIPFLMAGDPDIPTSLACLRAAARNGADIIELGFPYSDPLADGPTIQRASQRALARGMTFAGALEVARTIASDAACPPLLGFTYYNPVFTRGLARTAADFRSCGLSGIVVPDLPVDEAEPLLHAFVGSGLSMTFLAAPTTPIERVAHIARRCTDFLYVVSRLGITGADERQAAGLEHRLTAIRGVTDRPLAVGFGVGSPLSAARVAAVAEGVVVGSALIDQLHEASGSDDAISRVEKFCARMAAACRR